MSRAGDAHTRRSNRGSRQPVLCDRTLCACRECVKSDRSGVRPEDRVDVLEEHISPWPAAGPSEHEDCSNTLAARDLARSKVVRRDGPRLATERDPNVDGRREGYGKQIVCQHTTSLTKMWATHGRNSTHPNCQYLRQNSGLTHTGKRLEMQDHQ
jgi:hypothetical protein